MTKETIKRKLMSIWEYIETFLDTRFKQIAFFSAVVFAILLTGYTIALVHVGLFKLTFSVVDFYKAYQEPGKDYPWGVWGVLTLCILLYAALILWKNGTPVGGRNFELSKSNVYGSGREISQRELRQVTEVANKDAVLGTILCQLDNAGKQVVASKEGAMPNENMVVFGPPGCGKSTSYVLPFIMQCIMRRHSVIVSDTKGEVYAKTVEAARYNGYHVYRLDLKDPENSDGWHVLKELRRKDMRALTFAQTVMANSGNPKDSFYEPQLALLRAICLYQERMPDIPEEQRTFYHAYSLLLQGPETLDNTMKQACSAHPREMQVVMDAYSAFLQGSPNLRGNIISGLANRLGVLAFPDVRDMTSTDEIDFASVGKRPTILYISMSDQHQTMSFLASLAFSFAFLDLVELADSRFSQTLPVPVHFLMEEFGNLGRVNNIDNYLSTARSRKIGINLVVQSLGQLIKIYEENMTHTILADCATWMCLGCNDEATAKLLEWRSGEATVKVKTEQHDANEPAFKFAHQHSTGDGRRAFYTSNDIMKIKVKKEALVIWQQLDSLKANSFPIFLHREFIDGHMPTVSSRSLIPLSNKEAKKLFRKWENQRIKSFNTWLKFGGNPLRDYIGFENKTKGINSKKERPDITPIHVLQNMALAEAAGVEYDPTKDPYNPLYDGEPLEDEMFDDDYDEEEELIEMSAEAFGLDPDGEDSEEEYDEEQAEEEAEPEDDGENGVYDDAEEEGSSAEPIHNPTQNPAPKASEKKPDPKPAAKNDPAPEKKPSATTPATEQTPAANTTPSDTMADMFGGNPAGNTNQRRKQTEQQKPKTAFENSLGHTKEW